MASISGTSFQSQIDQLMEYYRYLEEAPIRRLESQKSTINSRLDIYSKLADKVRSLKTKIDEFRGIGSLSPFEEKTVELSQENIVKVTAGRAANPGNYSIKVQQLAKYDTVISNQITLSDTSLSATLGAGTHSFTIASGTSSSEVSINIEEGDTNEQVMEKIVDAIKNLSDGNIQAGIIRDTDNTGRISINAKNTGADYRISVTDGSSGLAALVGLDTSVKASGGSGGYLYETSELNAIFELNGMTITRSSNVLDDVIAGATLTLINTQSDTDAPVSVSVSNDVSKVKSNLQELITKFNDVIDYINSNSKIDTTKYTRGPLVGDLVARKLKSQLRELFTSAVSTAGTNGPDYLYEIGITFDQNGKLTISDSDKLDEALENNLAGVERLFTSEDGIATRVYEWLDDFTSSEGALATKKESYESQIRYLDLRIKSIQKNIDTKLKYYLEQFTALQSAMAKAQSQLNNMIQMVQIYY